MLNGIHHFMAHYYQANGALRSREDEAKRRKRKAEARAKEKGKARADSESIGDGEENSEAMEERDDGETEPQTPAQLAQMPTWTSRGPGRPRKVPRTKAPNMYKSLDGSVLMGLGISLATLAL